MEIISVGVLDLGVYWTSECTGLRSCTNVVNVNSCVDCHSYNMNPIGTK